MIAWLNGPLRARSDDGRIVIDCGGVGYAVQVPIGVAAQVDLGDPVALHIHTHVREDQLALYGFEDDGQLAAFHALIAVSKVGPKLALNVLGGISPAELAAAVDQQDLARLTTISGVGKRLAERLTVELKGKLDACLGATGAAAGRVRTPANSAFADLRSALANLQYRPKEIDSVLEELARDQPDAPFDVLLRRALATLRK